MSESISSINRLLPRRAALTQIMLANRKKPHPRHYFAASHLHYVALQIYMTTIEEEKQRRLTSSQIFGTTQISMPFSSTVEQSDIRGRMQNGPKKTIT